MRVPVPKNLYRDVLDVRRMRSFEKWYKNQIRKNPDYGKRRHEKRTRSSAVRAPAL